MGDGKHDCRDLGIRVNGVLRGDVLDAHGRAEGDGAEAREVAPRREARVGTASRALIAAALGLAACASDATGPAHTTADATVLSTPTTDTLCSIHQGHDPLDTTHEQRTFGTWSEDVLSAWGEPAEKRGDSWLYRWCVDTACTKKATVTVEFEQANLCDVSGKAVASGLFVAEIHADGWQFEKCWDPYRYNVPVTCDACSVDVERLGVCRG